MSNYLDSVDCAKYMAENYLVDLWLPSLDNDEERVEFLDSMIEHMQELREHYAE